jgi:hypothetical protein
MVRDLNNSRPFDVHCWSNHSEVNSFVNSLWLSGFGSLLDSIEPKRGSKPLSSLKKQFKVVLLDLYLCWCEDSDQCLGLSLSNGAFVANSRYNALHISKRIRAIVHTLVDHGLIGLHLGTEGANKVTRIWPEAPLIEYFEDVTFSHLLVGQSKDQEVIVLNEKVVRYNSKSGKEEYVTQAIEYLDSDHLSIPQWRYDLTQYNALLDQTYIDIGDLEDPWIPYKSLNKYGVMVNGKIHISQHRKFVRRVFYRGSWELGGRFHGGFWQRIKGLPRRNILINDQRTVEIDYSGLHVSLAYALEGIKLSQDPYVLPQILENYTSAEQRSVVKSLVLMAINAKSRSAAFRAFRYDQDTGSKPKTLINTVLSGLLDQFLEAHPVLEKYICHDHGVKFMKLDGEITAYVMNRFTSKGIPMLSVHDSYIVPYDKDQLLIEAMDDATELIVGQRLGSSYDTVGSGITQALINQDRMDTYGANQRWQSLSKLNTDIVRCKSYLARRAEWLESGHLGT